jgi:hypothetical protein
VPLGFWQPPSGQLTPGLLRRYQGGDFVRTGHFQEIGIGEKRLGIELICH